MTNIGIHADISIFGAMGCVGLPIMSSILVSDTSQIDDIYPIDADIVVDQARTILEDIQIKACKIGLLGSVENVAAVAEIISDYPQMPIILDPFNTSIPVASTDAEDLLLSIRELLIPQATVLILSTTDLALLAETWEGDEETIETNNEIFSNVTPLIDVGCQFVLVTGAIYDGKHNTCLLFSEAGLLQSMQAPSTKVSSIASNAISAAMTAFIGCGLDVPSANIKALEFAEQMVLHTQRIGMGNAVPKHFFWAEKDHHFSNITSSDHL